MFESTRTNYESRATAIIYKWFTDQSIVPDNRLYYLGQKIARFQIAFILYSDRSLDREKIDKSFIQRVAQIYAQSTADSLQTTNDKKWGQSEKMDAYLTSRNRARQSAVTFVTSIISQTDQYLARLYKYKLVWYTSRLENVCPICKPLHLKPASVWRRKFKDGPPAHPTCNCSLKRKS